MKISLYRPKGGVVKREQGGKKETEEHRRQKRKKTSSWAAHIRGGGDEKGRSRAQCRRTMGGRSGVCDSRTVRGEKGISPWRPGLNI